MSSLLMVANKTDANDEKNKTNWNKMFIFSWNVISVFLLLLNWVFAQQQSQNDKFSDMSDSDDFVEEQSKNRSIRSRGEDKELSKRANCHV